MSGKRKKSLFERLRPRQGRKSSALKTSASMAAVVGLVLMSLSFAGAPAQATPGGGSDVCAGLDSGKKDTTGDPQTVTVTAPEGKLIDGYCVKAGSSNQGYGPVYVDVDPPVKTLTFGYPGGKAVSHYSLSYIDSDACPDLDGNQPPGTQCTQPADDRETRDLPGVVDCESDTYTVAHQERTREYSWDGDSWEPGAWSDWTTYDTTVTEATDEQCPPPPNECPSLSGSVKTTLPDGSAVDGNIYDNKSDVYIYGEQLDEVTTVYVRVTDPSGSTVLSDTKEVAVVNGSFGPVQLPTFGDSPNNGDEYKVWVSTSPDFESNKCTKFDNFKVRGEKPPTEIEIPVAPSVTDLCGPDNATWNVPADTDTLDWELLENGHLTVTILPEDTVFTDGTTSHDYGVAEDSNEPCPPGTVAPATFQVNGPSCNTDGSLIIPEQPEGVLVTPAPGTYGPGMYDVDYDAEEGLVLSNDPSTTVTVLAATGYQDEDGTKPCYVEREPDKQVKTSERESCKLGGVQTTTMVHTTSWEFNEETQQWESSEMATSSLSFEPYTAAELKEKGCSNTPSSPTNPDNPTFDTGLGGPSQGEGGAPVTLLLMLTAGIAGGLALIASPVLARVRRR